MCGFVSAEKSAAPLCKPDEARIVLPHDAAPAVTAQRLDAETRAELLRVFEILRVASPDADQDSNDCGKLNWRQAITQAGLKRLISFSAKFLR